MIARTACVLTVSLLALAAPAGAAAQDADTDQARRAQEPSGEAGSLSRTEDALKRIIQEAAGDGVVSLRADQPTKETDAEAAAAQQTPPQPAAQTMPQTDGIGALIAASDEETSATKPKPVACKDNDLFVFGQDGYSWDGVTRLQTKVVGSATEPTADQRLELARHYLALGFAEEAMAVVEPIPGPRARTVYHMGEVVRGVISDGNSLRAHDSMCTGEAGLWRAVALIDSQPVTSLFLAEDSLDVLRGLPPHLRTDFATRLGVLAAEQDRWVLAQTLYDIATEGEALHTTPVLYLKSLINAHLGQDEQIAMNTIRRIAARDGEWQAKALLMLSRLQPAQEGEHYPGYYRDLENVSTRHDGNAQTFTEAFMEARLAAETGRYDRAVEIAEGYRYPALADRETMRNTLAGLFETALARANAETRFAALDGFLQNTEFFAETPRRRDLTLAAARAASDLGLPGIAIDLIGALPDVKGDEETTALLAKAYLEDARFAEAAELDNGESERLAGIAIEAYRRAGLYDTALSRIEKGEGTKAEMARRARLAWTAGNWTAARDAYAALMVESDDTALAARHALASYMAGQPGALESVDRPISMERLDDILATHTEEMKLLREVLSHG